MKILRKIIREEIEDFDWIQNQKPEPWEEFMFPYTNLEGKLEYTSNFGEQIVYRDEKGEWIFFHKQNPENDFVWFNYDKIWSVFIPKFGFEDEEIEEILNGWLEEHYNLRGVTAMFQVISFSWKSITI